MSTSPDAGEARVTSLKNGDPGRRPVPTKRGTTWRTLLLWLGSFAVMSPWPLAGILLTRSSFDEASEAFLLFGGVTMFPLMLLALFGVAEEGVLIAGIMLAWVSVAVVPGLWFGRRRLSRWAVVGVLGAQMAVSFAQAAMGALLVLGKNV